MGSSFACCKQFCLSASVRVQMCLHCKLRLAWKLRLPLLHLSSFAARFLEALHKAAPRMHLRRHLAWDKSTCQWVPCGSQHATWTRARFWAGSASRLLAEFAYPFWCRPAFFCVAGRVFYIFAVPIWGPENGPNFGTAHTKLIKRSQNWDHFLDPKTGPQKCTKLAPFSRKNDPKNPKKRGPSITQNLMRSVKQAFSQVGENKTPNAQFRWVPTSDTPFVISIKRPTSKHGDQESSMSR